MNWAINVYSNEFITEQQISTPLHQKMDKFNYCWYNQEENNISQEIYFN